MKKENLKNMLHFIGKEKQKKKKIKRKEKKMIINYMKKLKN